MHVPGRNPARVTLVLAAAAVVLVIGAATAFGRDHQAPPNLPVASGIVAPTWCCGTSDGVPGLTVYGQANVDGQDAAARDAAIAAAVKDAMAQANAAADAAGIQLGSIVDLQVSAAPVAYPMLRAGFASGSSTGSSTSAGSSTGGGTDPVPDPAPYFGSVSVTITWSIG
jgi:hypothetical protein